MKKLVLICAPVTSRSGYGAHARDLVTSFLNHNKYDIKIMDVNWGECPRNALNPKNKNDKRILDCILPEPVQLEKQPDVYIDIRIPNEFQTHGKFNIGITAGIETTAVSAKWIEGCNKMDLIIVPSEHSKQGFVSSIYDKLQNMPDGSQQKVGDFRLQKPMEVLFEGADEEIYKPLNKDEIDSEFFDWLNTEVPEKFAFLMVGQWGKGGFGEDRKNIGKLIKLFYESFANQKKQPALVLKTNGATYSIMDKEECLQKINSIKDNFPKDWKLPNVYLLHGDLSDVEMNYLYNHPKIKSMVSLTHGEGFGRPLLEATMTGLPIIATSWSGHTDFLPEEKTIMIPGELKQVPKSQVWKDILIEESQWFEASENHTHNALKYSYENINQLQTKASNLMKENRDKFTLNKMTEKLDEIMESHIKDIPQQVGLKLPKLKRVNKDLNELPNIKLPKLKKVTDEVTV